MSYTFSVSEFNVDTSVQGDSLKYHPLDALYYIHNSTQRLGGDLSFAGFNLNKSPLFNNVRAIWVEFSGESNRDREGWADPLRARILYNLGCFTHQKWCLNVKGDIRHPSNKPTSLITLDEDIKRNFINLYGLSNTSVSMPFPYGLGRSEQRLIVQYPNNLITEIVEKYWPVSYPGAPIEAYLLPENGIQLIQYWETQERNEKLFSEVLDASQFVMFTEPAEHRHLVFLTNKFDKKTFCEIVDVESLKNLIKN